MGREFLMVLNWRYLPRAIVLHHSLAAVSPSFRLRVYCMDDATERILGKLALPGVDVVGVGELERDDPELAAVRSTRSHAEYCQTAKPAALLHALTREPTLELLSLVDADLCFYEDPAILLSELGPQDSILLVPHRYTPEREYWASDSGEYNSGFVSFRNDADGLDALQWWRERCLEWCHYRVEPERFTDQRYLHDWPATRAGVKVLRHPGGGLAPWNMHRHQVELRDGKIHVDGSPLVFFHFSTLRLYRGVASLRRYGFGRGEFELTRGSRSIVWTADRKWRISTTDRELLWHPYVREIASAGEEIAVVEPRFDSRMRAEREQLRRAAPRPRPPAIRVPRPIRRAALGVLKNSVTAAALRGVLTLVARSKRARFHFFGDVALEAALCAIFVPDRMQLHTVSLTSLFPAANSVAISVDVLPEGDSRTPLEDLIQLLKIVRLTAARRVLELGSHPGITAAYIARNLPDDGTVVAVDEDPEDGSAYRGAELEPKIERRTGRIGPWLFPHDPPGSYDLIFIDAEHSEGALKLDTALALRLVSPSGHIVWHDYRNRGYFNRFFAVPEVLGELAQSKTLVHIANSSLAVHSPAWDVAREEEHRSENGERSGLASRAGARA
jgi:hypothetical protein